MLTAFLIIDVLVLLVALIGLGHLFIKNRENLDEIVEEYEDKLEKAWNRSEHYRTTLETFRGKDQVIAYQALEQGLEEAVDDHAQEQASWDESRIQYEATIDDLKAQVNSLSGQRDALQHELKDVQETALQMQIDLQAKE